MLTRNQSTVHYWTCLHTRGYKRGSEKGCSLFMEGIMISSIVHLRSGLLIWREAALEKRALALSKIKHFGVDLSPTSWASLLQTLFLFSFFFFNEKKKPNLWVLNLSVSVTSKKVKSGPSYLLPVLYISVENWTVG